MIRRRKLLKSLDRLMGGILVRLFCLRKNAPPPKPLSAIQTVLVIRPGGLGDAVLLIPMLRALKARFPSATIHALAERRNAEIFGWAPDLVTTVFCYDRGRDLMRLLTQRYDLVIDTEQWHRLSAVAARMIRAGLRCGFATNERGRLFNIPVAYDRDRYEAENFLAIVEALTGKPAAFDPDKPFLKMPRSATRAPITVLIAPGASYPEKQWGLEKFRHLAKWLVDRGHAVGLIGGPTDVGPAASIAEMLPLQNFVGRATLRETARLIAEAGLVISGDSVALHLAAALGTASIALFGPTSPRQWAPRGHGRRTLYHPPHCSPCSRFGHIPPCPYDVDCLKHITVEEVQGAAQEIMTSGIRKPDDHSDKIA